MLRVWQSITQCIEFAEYGQTTLHRIYVIRTDIQWRINYLQLLFVEIPSADPLEGIYIINVYSFIVC